MQSFFAEIVLEVMLTLTEWLNFFKKSSFFNVKTVFARAHQKVKFRCFALGSNTSKLLKWVRPPMNS
jgi:hypothetical protein